MGGTTQKSAKYTVDDKAVKEAYIEELKVWGERVEEHKADAGDKYDAYKEMIQLFDKYLNMGDDWLLLMKVVEMAEKDGAITGEPLDGVLREHTALFKFLEYVKNSGKVNDAKGEQQNDDDGEDNDGDY